MSHSVAVIGLGYFSQFHLKSWAEDPRADLVGVTDLNADLVAKAAADWSTTGFPSVEDMLEATDPAVIDIVAPPPAHANLIRAVLKHGRTIICQKPFATSLNEAEALTAEAEAAGADLIIHENFRFQPWHRALKDWLDSGAMGEVWQARFDLRPGDGRGPRAYLDRQPTFQVMERLLIHETAVHFIDLFRWFFGPITGIYADLRRLNPVLKGEDAGLMITEHDDGLRAVFDGNRLTDHVSDNPRRTMGELEIIGEAGTVTMDGTGALFFRKFGEDSATPLPQPFPVDETSFGGGCVAALNAHVIDALEGQGTLQNRARDYLPVIRATLAAYDSAETRQRIPL